MSRQAKRAVIKEEFVLLTGNFVSALILNQFIYWSERTRDIDKYLQEEALRQKNDGREVSVQPVYGWIYKRAEELSEELMLDMSPNTIRKYTKQLIDAGFLAERTNPTYKWDKTLQYRPNITKIQTELLKLGCSLEGYIVETADCISNRDSCGSRVDDFGAIPEITTEITTDISIASQKEEKQSLPDLSSEDLVNMSYDDLESLAKAWGKYGYVVIVNYWWQLSGKQKPALQRGGGPTAFAIKFAKNYKTYVKDNPRFLKEIWSVLRDFQFNVLPVKHESKWLNIEFILGPGKPGKAPGWLRLADKEAFFYYPDGGKQFQNGNAVVYSSTPDVIVYD